MSKTLNVYGEDDKVADTFANYSSQYEYSDDESSEDEAANSGVLPAAGFMQESSSAGSVSAVSPDRSGQPDIEEMRKLWSGQYEQIVQEEVHQAVEALIESRLSTMVALLQQMLMPPPSYYQQQMLPPVPPHYDQLQIPCMQESSSAVSISAASTGQYQHPDIEEMRRLWKMRVNLNSLILKRCGDFGRVNMIT
ncbi:hypothetical protein TSUD_93040 [Trifolium subterraneum]|uniref:Uncharacterized protein n=1 Tax=Trifolium subterraneum TaxID=3900 RepID=A0A2Z6P5M7_TRISU|nr:hypothetical protein TSUD_93040 [Trifolium subterraneum]